MAKKLGKSIIKGTGEVAKDVVTGAVTGVATNALKEGILKAGTNIAAQNQNPKNINPLAAKKDEIQKEVTKKILKEAIKKSF